MAKLTTRKRDRLKSSDFGLPRKRAYPMEDRGHAIAAKSRASAAYREGHLTAGAYHKIVTKANRKIKHFARRSTRR